MRTNQGIFRAVIRAGFYVGIDSGYPATGYMCNSLSEAKREGVITDLECASASAALNKYMAQLNLLSDCNCAILWWALARAYPGKVQRSDMVEFYKQWNKRP